MSTTSKKLAPPHHNPHQTGPGNPTITFICIKFYCTNLPIKPVSQSLYIALTFGSKSWIRAPMMIARCSRVHECAAAVLLSLHRHLPPSSRTEQTEHLPTAQHHRTATHPAVRWDPAEASRLGSPGDLRTGRVMCARKYTRGVWIATCRLV